MEEPLKLQTTTNDDEVLLKQKDGSFRLVKVSELNSFVSPPIRGSQRGSETSHGPPLVPPDRGEILPVSPNKGEAKPFIPSIQLLDQTAEELIKKSGLTIAPDWLKRFKIIIISRLKDVRKLPEARERLLAAPALGGVGLKPEEAERVMKMVEELRITNSELRTSPPIRGSQRGSEAQERPPLIPPDRGEKLVIPPDRGEKLVIPPDRGERLPPPPPTPPKPTTFTPVNQLTSQPASPPPVMMPSRPKPVATSPQPSPREERKPATFQPFNRLTSKPLPTSSEIQSTTTPSTLKIVSQAAKSKVELAPLPPAPVKLKPISAIPQTPAGRAKVEDVAYKPRLVGPLEELREMTLVDFRRLAPQAKVTTDKIYAKIELLAGEGYAKKIKGVEAWQKSPVNRIYLTILNESIVQGKPVDKVIGSKETLSKEEFQAIMDLNRRLRF